jgi:tetratricopeptide (TPR) repeat protein
VVARVEVGAAKPVRGRPDRGERLGAGHPAGRRLSDQRRARAEVERADRQGERADANYREARDTLNRIVTRFQDKRLADVPKLKELRRDVLEHALWFYRRVLDEIDPANPAVRFDTAVALEQAGKLQAALGNPREAEENVRRAVALFEALAAEEPGYLDHSSHLAACLQQLGMLCYRRAGPGADAIQDTIHPAEQAVLDEALAHLLRAWRLRDRLVQAEPGQRRRREELASAHFDLAKVSSAARKREATDKHCQAAVAIRTELWQADPADRANAAELAELHRVLGMRASRVLSPAGTSLSERRQRLDEVERHYARAEALLERLVRDVPEEPEYAQLLARLWTSWGHVLRPYPDLATKSLDRYTRAVRLLEPLLSREPRDASLRRDLHNAHGGRAYLHQERRRYPDSLSDWDRVVELSEGGDRAFNRTVRATVLAQAGEHASAAAEARELVANPEGSGDVVFNAATALAQACKAAAGDQRLDSPDRSRVAEGYAREAIAALRKLKEAGYFAAPEHVGNLRGDPDLEPLRRREDFQRLLREVSEALPKKPGR